MRHNPHMRYFAFAILLLSTFPFWNLASRSAVSWWDRTEGERRRQGVRQFQEWLDTGKAKIEQSGHLLHFTVHLAQTGDMENTPQDSAIIGPQEVLSYANYWVESQDYRFPRTNFEARTVSIEASVDFTRIVSGKNFGQNCKGEWLETARHTSPVSINGVDVAVLDQDRIQFHAAATKIDPRYQTVDAASIATSESCFVVLREQDYNQGKRMESDFTMELTITLFPRTP